MPEQGPSAPPAFDLKIPSLAGSYLLVLYLRRKTSIRVGRLGELNFPRGWYYYAGSAFGPGGLKARLSHHCKPLQRFHWHIDYLRAHAELRGLWFQTADNFEHRWSRALSQLPKAVVPVAGFGSSDCRCPSHLIYFPCRQRQLQLRKSLGGVLDYFSF